MPGPQVSHGWALAERRRAGPYREARGGADFPGRIYASPTNPPGTSVGAAYMPPGPCAAAQTSPGGINPSPTTKNITLLRFVPPPDDLGL